MSQHILVGAAGSLPVFWISHSFQTTLAFFLSNSLIDLDHLFDYWYDHGFNLNWNRFHKACGKADFIHFIVVLHSFEVLLLMLVVLFISRETIFYFYILGIFAGFGYHMAFDISFNKGMKLKYYFIFCRYLKNFKLDDMGSPLLLKNRRKGIE